MQITVLASGSTGNCSLITEGSTRILVDAGISCKRIKTGLNEIGVSPGELDAILITHDHVDHVSGLRVFEKNFSVPLYTTLPVIHALEQSGLALGSLYNEFAAGEAFEIGGVSIRPFHVPHDAADCSGFRLTGDSAVLGYATDIGCITDEIVQGLAGSDLALIEANHDVQMLKQGPYPYYLKQRILSSNGHLSNESCAHLAGILQEQGTRRFVLGHLSQQNNEPMIARRTVQKSLELEPGDLFVAPALGNLTVRAKVV